MITPFAFHAQDSHNMFCCLDASLSASARTEIYAESDTYTFRRGAVPGTVPGVKNSKKHRGGLIF
jgi:hypothetical protein